MLSKNLIYMVALNDVNSKISNLEYSIYSKYSWKYYCEKYDIDLCILDDNNIDEFKKTYQLPNHEFPIWFKEAIYKIGQQYGKIGLVDSDTIIRWDAPNIFDMIEDEGIYGVNDLCDLNWLLDSIKQRQKFFPDQKMDLTRYLNTGILFFGNKHLSLFKNLLNFYLENKDEIQAIKGGGKEQTLLNFFIQKEGIPVKVLDPEWNLLSIHRKNMFTGNWQLKVDPLPYFIKHSYVWHFTGFPIEDRVRLMKETWEIIKENYV